MSRTTKKADAVVARHTEEEIAEMWHMHRKTVHKIFDGQPGVLEWGEAGGRTKRPHRSRRIPESVMLRVHRICAKNPELLSHKFCTFLYARIGLPAQLAH